jgi:hypothetical protein
MFGAFVIGVAADEGREAGAARDGERGEDLFEGELTEADDRPAGLLARGRGQVEVRGLLVRRCERGVIGPEVGRRAEQGGGAEAGAAVGMGHRVRSGCYTESG